MTYQNVAGLGDVEAALLTTLAASGTTVFTTSDAHNVLGEIKPTNDAIQRLVSKGWLKRIEKGKYLIVPLEAGPRRDWTEDALVIAQHLVPSRAVAYWTALRYWNLTDQLPRVTYVQTTARKDKRRLNVFGMQFQIVRVRPRKFFGNHTDRTGQSKIHVTDREKTIIDCLDRPDLSGGVFEIAKALHEGDGRFDWARVTDYLERFGSGAVTKRLGFMVEASQLHHPPATELLDRWQNHLTSGISSLDPSSPQEPHRIATRWRVGVNVPEEALAVVT